MNIFYHGRASHPYGPSLTTLSGVLNQEKFSQIFNILNFFLLLRTRFCLIRFMYPALTFSDFVLFHFVSFVSLPFYYGHTFQKNRSCRIFVIHFLSLHNFVVIPKIRSKIRRCNKKVSTEQELSVRVAKNQRKTSCYFIFRCLTWKLTWLADNFLQNKSNFFICSQFRLEENFFKCVFLIEVSVYWALLNWTKQCTARYLLVQNCPHYCFSQHRCARGEFCPCCSKRNANHALMMFLKFIYSKNVKINNHSLVTSEKKKSEFEVCKMKYFYS